MNKERLKRLKKWQRKAYKNSVKSLNLTTDTEKFILYEILLLDWTRQVIVMDITRIESYNKIVSDKELTSVSKLKLVRVNLSTRGSLYSFSLSSFDHLTDKAKIDEVKKYIVSDLIHKVYR